ncbi:MAG: cyanophycin synthetase [Candidatus Latescibacteria bacterium]|jgi:dihydrofolate synthase/folylpolyglutamate synthase|nr:cyanophycin synthetase [Candidatus Latescibacterota bacterium]
MDYFRSKRFLDTLTDWERGDPVLGSLEDYLPRMRALLDRLEAPQSHFRSIIVGGTNGKGTVSSLLASLLRTAGQRVGLFTSPHLHTVRERIRIDGEIAEKEAWSEGVTHLYEKSRDFEREGFGAFSKFEALTALAAHLFARERVDCGIFEVGLGGRYDSTNAWDSDLAVLTAIQLDHTEVLGDTLEEIAADKFCIARPARPLFTSGHQAREVLALLRQQSDEHRVPLYVVQDDAVEAPPDGSAVVPPSLPGDPSGSPRIFEENARLALAAAARWLGSELDEAAAIETVSAHRWPGRFEVAQRKPWIVLDGAHNPAAAAALSESLRPISDRWTFVVGVGSGHDAEGVVGALAPLAKEMTLTRSAHPKAIRPESLQPWVPQGILTRCDSRGLQVLREAFAGLGPDDHLCVTGSLHLVALAREVLDLAEERDGFTEDVFLESLHCLRAACRGLGVEHSTVSDDGNLLKVSGTGESGPFYFMRNKHPFNDYVAGRLAEDKAYQYELFGEAGLLIPETLKVFSPLADARFDRYKTHDTIDDIVADVESRIAYPLVVKRNEGSMAQGVYLETGREGLRGRLRELCEASAFLNNILLIQAFVEGPEYRAVASEGELLLAYEKVSDEDDPSGDLNPLHQAGGRAERVDDPKLLQDMAAIVRRAAQVLNLGFHAIDLIGGPDGMTILEVNPNPICHFYNSHNGRSDFIGIYERLLRKFVLSASAQG